ncbi:Coenzyme F420 hydrogenase/dehydrogenase, beta subunit C-terminal domain [Selenomonas sp. oral taxon 126]|uniref:Coenzyme F420 hydrogenase/dehydrogenase, beta subunit C-terminal domain n=1 Tax=Selenomonas sp. oral taxon 126 TaxID=712528 RepID=UPI000A494814|nr:Coenzyme F420 hydrogenase/dehydrogenase, beta subunit C-terminal domain [Selenomonas sp. oral taxon 126]
MLVDKDSCTGCSACFSVCPTRAIKMSQDEEGFWHPIINMDKCISCGRCERACPLLHNVETREVREVYACYSMVNSIRLDSSSGGIFSVLSEQILHQGGIVFGAAFEEEYRVVRHIGVEDAEGISKLCGSKYVQSDMSSVFAAIQKYLSERRYVLFVGTPCQVAGLRNVVKKNIEYLLAVEFVCHGVPSPAVWSSFLQEIASDNTAIQGLKFRDKSLGWRKYTMKIFFEDGEIYRSNVEENLYLQGFLSGLYMRPSCYKCSFRKKKRVGDLMLGDCWGIERMSEDQSFLTDQGVSLLSIQSDLGEHFWKKIKSRLHIEKISYMQAMKYNRAIISDSYHHPRRSIFFKQFAKKTYPTSQIIADELDLNIKERLHRRLWAICELVKNWCIRNSV